MSEDLVVALLLGALGASAIVVGAIYALRQKVVYDSANNTVTTELEIPVFGKVKTNAPAIALCLIGAALGYFAYDLMKQRGPQLVEFTGEVNLDSESMPGIDAVMIGVTSGSWVQTATPNGREPKVTVAIPVPNSWPSYSAYAFTIGEAKTRPAIIGANLEDRQFSLRIRQ